MTIPTHTLPAVAYKRLHDDVPTPTRAHPTDAGVDLTAYGTERSTSGKWVASNIVPGGTFTIHTGIAAAIPTGYVGLLFARSSLGVKMRIDLANSVGVIDSDYRGEIKAVLRNTGTTSQTITQGQRICQLVVVPVNTVPWVEVERLDATDRGEGGFGSTGQ